MYTIDNAPDALLRDYATYVEGKIDIVANGIESDENEMPLRFEQWQEIGGATDLLAQPEVTPAEGKTIAETKKKRLIELFEIFHEAFEEDITSGIKDKIYEEADNVENLAYIEEAKPLIEWFKKYRPGVFVFVDGGLIQGASGTENISFELYDKDNYDVDSEANGGQTPEEWDNMINDLTAKNEITGIY